MCSCNFRFAIGGCGEKWGWVSSLYTFHIGGEICRGSMYIHFSQGSECTSRFARIFGSTGSREAVLLAIPAGLKLLVLCLSTQICEDNKLGRNVEKKVTELRTVRI